MLISISEFDVALRDDQSKFLQLRNARLLTDGIAAQLRHRTTRFWEACVEWQGDQYMVMLPLDNEVISDLERVIEGLKLSALTIAAPHAILKDEYTAYHPMGGSAPIDLALEKLPALSGARLLSDLLADGKKYNVDAIFDAVEVLERAFVDARICHNNLKTSNIIVSKDGQFLPIRYINASFEVKPQECAAEFDMLRKEILQKLAEKGSSTSLHALDAAQSPKFDGSQIADSPQWDTDSPAHLDHLSNDEQGSVPQWDATVRPYSDKDPIENLISEESSEQSPAQKELRKPLNHNTPRRSVLPAVKRSTMKISGEFEGLRRVFDTGRYGYIDERGKVVIDLHFLTAENFREDRAEVTDKNGCMGLINGRGKWIIPPHYAIVEFVLDHACVVVKQNNEPRSKWALFDYEGRALTPFELDYIRNEAIPQILEKYNIKALAPGLD